MNKYVDNHSQKTVPLFQFFFSLLPISAHGYSTFKVEEEVYQVLRREERQREALTASRGRPWRGGLISYSLNTRTDNVSPMSWKQMHAVRAVSKSVIVVQQQQQAATTTTTTTTTRQQRVRKSSRRFTYRVCDDEDDDDDDERRDGERHC